VAASMLSVTGLDLVWVAMGWCLSMVGGRDALAN